MGIIDDSDLYDKIYVTSNPLGTYTPDDNADEYYDLGQKYQFSITRLYNLFRENNIPQISDESQAAYVDLAWQAICKYLFVDYNDQAMIQRCGFAIAQLAYIYYHNDKVNRAIISGETPITQKTQGARSVTYGSKKIELDNSGLTPEIKAVLPPRRLRAF